jgi:hypothetical protein
LPAKECHGLFVHSHDFAYFPISRHVTPCHAIMQGVGTAARRLTQLHPEKYNCNERINEVYLLGFKHRFDVYNNNFKILHMSSINKCIQLQHHFSSANRLKRTTLLLN